MELHKSIAGFIKVLLMDSVTTSLVLPSDINVVIVVVVFQIVTSGQPYCPY